MSFERGAFPGLGSSKDEHLPSPSRGFLDKLLGRTSSKQEQKQSPIDEERYEGWSTIMLGGELVRKVGFTGPVEFKMRPADHSSRIEREFTHILVDPKTHKLYGYDDGNRKVLFGDEDPGDPEAEHSIVGGPMRLEPLYKYN